MEEKETDRTAAGMMEGDVVSVPIGITVQQATELLRNAPRQSLHYLYVTDEERRLAGVLGRIRGFIFGTCAECSPGEGSYASLTLEEIFADHIKPLGVPAWQGAMIGHQMPQWTIPEGIEAEMDAAAGTIKLLEPAVR